LGRQIVSKRLSAVQLKVVSAPAVGKGRHFKLMAQHNVSLDEEYAK